MPALRVMAPLAPVHREPRPSSEQVSQYRFGHPVIVLDEREAWVRIRGFDDYEGWMHRGYVRNAGDRANMWENARISLGCRIVLDDRQLELPLGALVPEAAEVVAGLAISEEERARRFPCDATAIVTSATALFPGTGYLWGGTTPWGADCSGFTQTILALHGVPLPRDAAQQAMSGRALSDSPPQQLSPADLLFFSDRADGHITHVGIAIGDARMAHCALGRGGYRLENLHTPDAYLTALIGRFRFARRVAGG